MNTERTERLPATRRGVRVPKAGICGLLLLLVLASTRLPAQSNADSSLTDISTLQFSRHISQVVSFAAPDTPVADKMIASIPFREKVPPGFAFKVPYRLVSKPFYLKFLLTNPSDSERMCYFFPGLFYKKIQVFYSSPSIRGDSLVEDKELAETDSDYYAGFRLIRVPPGTSRQFYIRLLSVKTPINNLFPRIINKSFISFFQISLHARKSSIGLITLLVSGILLMMIFYSFAVYLQNFKSEFLYYAAYAFLMGMLLFLKTYLYNVLTPFHYFFESFLDFLMQFLGYIFYLVFIRKFLDTRRNYPFLEKLLRFGEWVILAALAAYTAIYFLTPRYDLALLLENSVKQFLLVLGLIFIIYGVRKRNKLMNYLVAGQIILLLFSAFSLLLILMPIPFFKSMTGVLNIFNDSLLYYETGLLLELILFLSGLAYKNKCEIIEKVIESENLKMENERKEFEKQVAVMQAKQDERNRISADMHDELGSGVTAIRLMSEIVKSKMKGDTLPEIEKISYSANELLNKMNTIIWTMISSNDTVESLVAYIRAYSVDFFENTGVECLFTISENNTSREISGEKRRNIFLAVKEALNNVLKHSMATRVHIRIIEADQLTIEITDNGIGIDPDKLKRFGNGLNNMKKRIESMDGRFFVENSNGTALRFLIDL